MIILGLNAFHGDASACLVVDGVLVAAAEEERFRRVKHWAGLPTEAIRYCLEAGEINLSDIDRIAINRDPTSNAMRKGLFAFTKNKSLKAVADRLKNAAKIHNVRDEIAEHFGVSSDTIRAHIDNVEHHLAHLASAFFVSPFTDAAVVSVDGFGDFASTMWGLGRSNKIKVEGRTYFPHSLGLFYLAITQHLGFPNYGDEYKVMGLAPYGENTEINGMRKIVRLLPEGRFELDLEFFIHHSKGVSMLWDGGEPVIGKVFSPALEEIFGPARSKDDPLNQHHWNIAASAQAMYEEALFHILNHVQSKTNFQALSLAGGCAMNSVANGKILGNTGFKDVYIQSAGGDAGGAIGAAFAIWNQKLNKPRKFVMEHSYWGPDFSNDDVSVLLEKRSTELNSNSCKVTLFSDEPELCSYVSKAISDGKIIGWFQGRMEWGPRALGNRSILGDPRRSDMKEILNSKIKRRESFRPFAPSILREEVKNWFETDYDVPFMLQVFQILLVQRHRIPAVTHINGSGRLQTVTEQQNPRYYRLIRAFRDLTGVPILLNTSFNENEPVVCRPDEAVNCFLRTKMDILVLGDYVIERQ
ncbi:MAG: carbamoyltransferase C-terminal domain-containing protein [Burkholderiales bacterium]|nr:carbamoyltransferase C-terminal domain-containing protein [Burkholderiales bacterium]